MPPRSVPSCPKCPQLPPPRCPLLSGHSSPNQCPPVPPRGHGPTGRGLFGHGGVHGTEGTLVHGDRVVSPRWGWQGTAQGLQCPLGEGGHGAAPPGVPVTVPLGINVHLPPLPSQCVFDDLSGSVSLSWVGDSTGVSMGGAVHPKWLWIPLGDTAASPPCARGAVGPVGPEALAGMEVGGREEGTAPLPWGCHGGGLCAQV